MNQPLPQTNKWDVRFLQMAQLVASWSKDPSTKVGAVIVRPNRSVASVGFNGFARGVIDDISRYDDRPTKLLLTVHAETNAILSANENVAGHTIYVAPLHPCASCASQIVQAGIKRVVCLTAGDPDRWRESFRNASVILTEGGVAIDIVVPELAPAPEQVEAEPVIEAAAP